MADARSSIRSIKYRARSGLASRNSPSSDSSHSEVSSGSESFKYDATPSRINAKLVSSGCFPGFGSAIPHLHVRESVIKTIEPQQSRTVTPSISVKMRKILATPLLYVYLTHQGVILGSQSPNTRLKTLMKLPQIPEKSVQYQKISQIGCNPANITCIIML